MKNAAFLTLISALLIAMGAMWLGKGANAATGPCGTSHDAMDAEEYEFLGLLQAWRDANLSNSSPLQVSGPLNAAAAWFAEYQAEKGGLGGHYDDLGRNWVDRARDCGYDSYYAGGSGEGVYALAGSFHLDVGPAEALSGITYPGSGVRIEVPASPNFPPAKCVGVAVARNSSGTAVAWVAVIAQYPASQPCPDAAVTSPPVTGSQSPTATPTTTPTPTPTPDDHRTFVPALRQDGE